MAGGIAQTVAELSPHTRGCLPTALLSDSRAGVIPVHAGLFTGLVGGWSPNARYPRTRGVSNLNSQSLTRNPYTRSPHD